MVNEKFWNELYITQHLSLYSNNPKGCDSCMPGYSPVYQALGIGTRYCSSIKPEDLQLIPECVSYYYDGVQLKYVCKKCGVGFIIDVNNNCIEVIPEFLPFCKIAIDQSHCDQCLDSYHNIGQLCFDPEVPNDHLLSNCRSYTSESKDLNKGLCDVCEFEFYLTPEFTCRSLDELVPHCKEWDLVN